jgi:hypothetical protein
MENQLYDLDKIKDLTSSLGVLQGKINLLEEISKKYAESKDSLVQNFEKNINSNQLNELTTNINFLIDNLTSTFNKNIIAYLSLKNELIHNYKQSIKENLKDIENKPDFIRKLGLNLIENKKINKIFNKPTFIYSIGISQWLDLTDALKENTLFLNLINKLSIYYTQIIKTRLNNELKKIPENTNEIIIKEFKRKFHKNPHLTFKQFLINYESRQDDVNLESREEFIRKRRKSQELQELKKKQVEQQEEYENYFKLSETEFDRRRRKKSREKLEAIKKDKKPSEDFEISDEVSEKIEKFKSQFDKKFERDYLIDQNEDTDPIDLIRERKTKKKKEFEEYKEHFDDI